MSKAEGLAEGLHLAIFKTRVLLKMKAKMLKECWNMGPIWSLYPTLCASGTVIHDSLVLHCKNMDFSSSPQSEINALYKTAKGQP